MRILILLLFFTTEVFAQRQHLIFESSFEDSSLAEWNAVQECFIDRVSTSSIIKRYGSRSGRFYSKAIDSAGCTEVRSQVIFNDNQTTSFERWYGFSVYFGQGFPVNYDGVEFFLEFLRNDTVDYTPLGLCYQGFEQGVGSWPSGLYITSYSVRRTPPPASPYTIFINPLSTIQMNRWNDVVIRAKWSPDTTGKIRIWVNDTLRFSYDGVTNYAPHKLRIGIDKWDWRYKWNVSSSAERELYFDEVRIGDSLATYSDVRPGFNVALPIRWLLFQAAKRDRCVELQWEAEFGNNFEKFIVERNTGSGWEIIGEVKNGTRNSFKFTDCEPRINNLYRIRAINVGELDSYSKTLSVRFSDPGPQNVQVYNMLGQLVKRQRVSGISVQQIVQQLNLPTGFYVIRYENGESEKIFKQ